MTISFIFGRISTQGDERMILLPMMQEMTYVGGHYKDPSNKKTKDYIYLQEENKILKFDVGFSYFEVLRILERYINYRDINDYTIITHKELEENNIPTGVLPYLGKFRLEGNFRRTNNYLAPKESDHLFLWLCEKLEERTLFSQDLECLYKTAKLAFEDGEEEQLQIIKDLIEKVGLAFIESYTVDYNELSNKINELENKGDKSKLNELKWIIETAKENKKYLKSLGLYDKFLERAGLNKQNQKIKL